MKRLVLCCLACPMLLLAIKKEHDWKQAKVVDYVMSAEDMERTKSDSHHIAADNHVVMIQAGDTIFTAWERAAWHGSCLLIVGDDIKYERAKDDLVLLDAVGAPCRLKILHTAKIQ